MFTRAEKKQENPKAAPSSGVLLGGARTPNSAMLQRPAGAPGGGNLPNSLMLRRLQGASGASTGADALQAGMQANRAPLPPTPAATAGGNKILSYYPAYKAGCQFPDVIRGVPVRGR
ncbi:MAG: hypothetical protein PHO41_05710, partial [Eubacteriales bacterium]|nr:hypothetical protein [Eubacteriales bacterium]